MSYNINLYNQNILPSYKFLIYNWDIFKANIKLLKYLDWALFLNIFYMTYKWNIC